MIYRLTFSFYLELSVIYRHALQFKSKKSKMVEIYSKSIDKEK